MGNKMDPAAQSETDPAVDGRRKSGIFDWIRRFLGINSGLQQHEKSKDKGQFASSLQPPERNILTNLMALSALRVDDVMVARVDVEAVEEGIELTELRKIFIRTGYSRLLVYRGMLDHPTGIIHLRDFIGIWDQYGEDQEKKFRLNEHRGNVLFIPPSMPVMDLLLKMQISGIHMALIIDEYGGTDGLVALSDLVEQVVGKIADEKSEADAPQIIAAGKGQFIASGRAEIEDFNALSGIALGSEENDDVDTLGGLIFTMLGRVPERGEIVLHPAGLEFHIIDADSRRITRLEIYQTDIPARNDSTAFGKKTV